MSFKRLKVGFGLQIKIVIFICMLLFGIELVNLFTGRYLNQFGLIPRSLPSLPGIIVSPFLHGSFLHFVSNIIPLAIFSFLMLQHGVRRFALVTAFCILVSGLLIWLLGRNAIHVGASGLIYGYFAYLLLAGILSKEIKLIVISLLVGFGYGGLIFGVLPVNPYVSWESHLFGFIVGLGSAFLWGNDAHSSILPAQ